jgi:hypothetical protein
MLLPAFVNRASGAEEKHQQLGAVRSEGLQQNSLEGLDAHRVLPRIETIQECVVMSHDLIERKGLGVCC